MDGCGPPIGTVLLMYGTQLPFWLAAISASIPLFMIQCFVQRSVVDHSTEEKNSVKVGSENNAKKIKH